eukprot:13367832-Heterocapsa_arctica.AAC.1
MVEALARAKLPVHKVALGEGLEALGAVIGSRPYCVSAARRKLILLLVVTEAFAHRPMTFSTLERLVGLWGWTTIFCRPACSVLGN